MLMLGQGDNGGAVTNVVTEFMKKTSRGTKPIAADVKFFCLELCENLTKKWFDHWYALELKPEDEIDDQDRARKTAALECLDALFAGKISVPIEKYLARTKSQKDTTILKKLLEWAREIHGIFVKDGETSVEFGSHTHVDMREQLRPFRAKAHNAMYQGRGLQTSPWPFVEIIRYYLSNAILEQGNCIADVPGANDANMYRVEMANAYLQTCEFTIVTGEIKRILSDASYRQHYLDAHHRRYHGSVILFCTKSDELNDDGGSNLQLDTEAEEVILPIEERLKALRGEIDAIDEKVERNKKEIKRAQRGESNHYTDDETRLNTAPRSLQQLKEDNKALKLRKKEIPSLFPPLEKQCRDARVACRNRHVALGLDQNYRNDTGDDGGAKVFCLSNRMFMRYLRGYNHKVPEKTPTMSLESTQVLAACAYLYGIPSQGKTAILEHSVVFTIPALLDLIQMSCSKSTEARVEYVLKIVDRAIENLEVQIEALAAHCNETFVKTLWEALSDHGLQDTFDRCATASLADWDNNLAAATHRALVNKRGSYSQKRKGVARVDFNWNERLLSPVRDNIERAFRVVLDEACPAFQASAAQAIKSVFRDLNQTLKGDPQALAGDAYKLCIGNRLKAHEANITLQVQQATKKLFESFNAMKRKATRTNENDYFYDGMIPIYTGALQAKAQKGKTLKLARHEYLKQHIPGEEGPLRVIADFTREDAEEAVEEIRNYLRNNVIGVFRHIHNAFTGQKTRKENDSPEGQQFRKDLHMLVDKAREVMQGVVLESLERCKEHK
ncbi:hypothetical protein BDU57DRAFT_108689 [Ampelomyces quisqualis]|uniref:DUF7605 domain-containing protein n=1 Tax=Ampelomyces quisqualis TaxID=50730 RepID=A0A6A5Q658_AMPQU|nr:hypothetical protein BDU57DRAFT_108689 [Ampelomyces quisqualis]